MFFKVGCNNLLPKHSCLLNVSVCVGVRHSNGKPPSYVSLFRQNVSWNSCSSWYKLIVEIDCLRTTRLSERKFQPVLAKIFQQSEQHLAQTVKIWSGIFCYILSFQSVFLFTVINGCTSGNNRLTSDSQYY